MGSLRLAEGCGILGVPREMREPESSLEVVRRQGGGSSGLGGPGVPAMRRKWGGVSRNCPSFREGMNWHLGECCKGGHAKGRLRPAPERAWSSPHPQPEDAWGRPHTPPWALLSPIFLPSWKQLCPPRTSSASLDPGEVWSLLFHPGPWLSGLLRKLPSVSQGTPPPVMILAV